MERTRRFKGNKGKYLAELAASPTDTIEQICTKVNISRTTYYTWLKDDETFAGQIDKVRQASMDVFEQILGGYVEKLANRLIELAEQTEDKRTALEAVKEIKKLLNRGEKKDTPSELELNIKWGSTEE